MKTLPERIAHHLGLAEAATPEEALFRSKPLAYGTWKSMHDRCKKPHHISFERYGARGIKVCERWNSFDMFFCDMGERRPDQSIERIDNDGNYEPENCRWATAKEQSNNRSSNVFLELGGVRQTLAQWGAQLGVSASLISKRLRLGWSAIDSLSFPKFPFGRRKKKFARKTHCIHGHPLSGENLFVYRKRWICKTCQTAAWARKRIAKKMKCAAIDSAKGG